MRTDTTAAPATPLAPQPLTSQGSSGSSTTDDVRLAMTAELQTLREQARQLTTALQTGRNVGVATGILMAQFHISQQEALERLRRQARSKRARLDEVAAELLAAAEQFTALR